MDFSKTPFIKSVPVTLSGRICGNLLGEKIVKNICHTPFKTFILPSRLAAQTIPVPSGTLSEALLRIFLNFSSF
ncbi:MAG: hypothetical protein ACD_65C00142G0001 [uncultured bacterium]|nr:MAG: hypothetical protein ACD_65C00142G0001 [uncultured bacterium]